MSERKDISEFGASLLADTRKRRDDQYAIYKRDRDKREAEIRKRERNMVLYGYGAKALLSIGNRMVKDATHNFLNREDILKKNMEFKRGVEGATGRTNDRNAAMTFEAGEDEWYRQKAMASMLPTFNAAVPESLNATQREALLYNESKKAGEELKKFYKQAEEKDRLLLERVGTDGAEAYTKALVSERGTDIGSSLYRKFKGLFKKDGDPLDNSISNSLYEMVGKNGVVGYGELRKQGLAPFMAEEKIKEWKEAGLEMSPAIVNTEFKDFKGQNSFGYPITKTYKITTFANGQTLAVDASSGMEVQPSDMTLEQKIYAETKNAARIQNLQNFKVTVNDLVPSKDIDDITAYAELLVDNSTSKEKVKDVADHVYARIKITSNYLKQYGLNETQAVHVATKMNAINARGIVNAGIISDKKETHKTLLTGNNNFHPALAALAIKEIQQNEESTVHFHKNVLRTFLEENRVAGAEYDAQLSKPARARLIEELSKHPEFTRVQESSNTGKVPPPKDVVIETKTEEPRVYTMDEVDRALSYHYRTNPQNKKIALAGNDEQKRKLFDSINGAKYINKEDKRQERTDKIVGFFKSSYERQKAINNLSETDKLIFNRLSRKEQNKFLAERSEDV